MDVTNSDRAGWALTAVRAFQQATGSDDDTAIYDMLCDLHHLADEIGLDWDGLLGMADYHYEAEVEEEREDEDDYVPPNTVPGSLVVELELEGANANA